MGTPDLATSELVALPSTRLLGSGRAVVSVHHPLLPWAMQYQPSATDLLGQILGMDVHIGEARREIQPASLYDQCTCGVRQTRRIADPRDLAIAHEHRLMRDSARVDHIDDRNITKSEGAVVGTPAEYVENTLFRLPGQSNEGWHERRRIAALAMRA